ncbi:MAG: hypothetical protein AAGA75_16925 [Cyanobacteria bacterium P01_E01_bin.6]
MAPTSAGPGGHRGVDEFGADPTDPAPPRSRRRDEGCDEAGTSTVGALRSGARVLDGLIASSLTA